MNQLAEIHLRQARSFLNAGDAPRAVELLEKARALSRDDRTLLRKILPELAAAYRATGQHDLAARCQTRLDAFGGPVGTPSAASMQSQLALPPRRRRKPWGALAASVVVLALLAGSGFYYLRVMRPTLQIAATQPASEPVAEPAQFVSPPSSLPASPPPATTQKLSATVVAPANIDPADYVPLIVVMGRYESSSNGVRTTVDLPIASGSGFVIHASGIIVTNRHVTDAGKQDNAPISLEKIGLPTFILTRTRYVVCFGSNVSDHLEGEMIYEGEKKDLALLRVQRTFKNAITVAARMPKQGEDIRVYGYPGVLLNMHNDLFMTDERKQTIADLAMRGKTVDLLNAGYSPESFKVSVTRGIVSVAQIIVQDVPSMQTDAKVAEGNSGGPILNMQGEVVAITTWGGTGDVQGYNWGQLLDDELRQEIFAHVGGN